MQVSEWREGRVLSLDTAEQSIVVEASQYVIMAVLQRQNNVKICSEDLLGGGMGC